VVVTVGESWLEPLIWAVGMLRTVPSLPVAVIVREVALVVVHVKVTDWPDVMLLALALKVNVGAGVGAAVTATLTCCWTVGLPLLELAVAE
jgi:hypothetical protein